MTIQAVADHLRVGWDSIKALFKSHLQTRFAQPKLKKLKRLAIDEISIGHGHRDLTVVPEGTPSLHLVWLTHLKGVVIVAVLCQTTVNGDSVGGIRHVLVENWCRGRRGGHR